jgi:hypothetical protein
MLSDVLDYQIEIEKLLAANSRKTDWNREYHYFKTQLKNLQHERLIHLLVTMTVGIAALVSYLSLAKNFSLPTFLLCLILLPLFGAYIIHYRKLENTTQYWYQILKKLSRLRF